MAIFYVFLIACVAIIMLLIKLLALTLHFGWYGWAWGVGVVTCVLLWSMYCGLYSMRSYIIATRRTFPRWQ